jgi:hypothetical protein
MCPAKDKQRESACARPLSTTIALSTPKKEHTKYPKNDNNGKKEKMKIALGRGRAGAILVGCQEEPTATRTASRQPKEQKKGSNKENRSIKTAFIHNLFVLLAKIPPARICP